MNHINKFIKESLHCFHLLNCPIHRKAKLSKSKFEIQIDVPTQKKHLQLKPAVSPMSVGKLGKLLSDSESNLADC
jgi:hypothetical protein